MKKNTFKNIMIYFMLIFVMTSIISVGYGALQIDLTITSTINVKKDNMLVNNTDKSKFLDCSNILSSSVTKIKFQKYRPSSYVQTCDVSASQDNTIMAYQKSDGTVYVVSDGIIFSNTKTKFRDLVNCSEIDFGNSYIFNTRNLENMNNMFNKLCNSSSCSMETLDLSTFDTSKVTSMISTFGDAKGINNINFGSNYNTSNVTSTQNMFNNCKKLTTLDLSSFDTHQVCDMSHMFAEATSLSKVIVNGTKWNVDNVGNCQSGTGVGSGDSMFYNTQLTGTGIRCGMAGLSVIEYAHIDSPSNPGCFRAE